MLFNFPICCLGVSDTPQLHMQVQDIARENSFVEIKPLNE